MAALYSAGVSTLTGTYNALTTVTLEDVVKPVLNHISPSHTLSTEAYLRLAKYLPFFFGTFAACGAFMVHKWDAMILQISLSIFGSAGGGTFGVFCVGIFCPWITSKMAALSGQITSTLICFILVAGTAINKVHPVNLPLSSTCEANKTAIRFTTDLSHGRVVSNDQYSYVWSSISEVSYQYYSVIGLCVCLFVSHVLQLIENCLLGSDEKKVDPKLLATFLRPNTQKVLLRNDVCLKDSLLPT
uniref:Sodium-dependent multivitamin transporter n=1 Tax=Ditylenchus dipsaci TaxID=166011 RepID=A0A915DUE2_9BILA